MTFFRIGIVSSTAKIGEGNGSDNRSDDLRQKTRPSLDAPKRNTGMQRVLRAAMNTSSNHLILNNCKLLSANTLASNIKNFAKNTVVFLVKCYCSARLNKQKFRAKMIYSI
jgi:hypothetical protein